MKYIVRIELDGEFVTVGAISNMCFSYSSEYLSLPNAVAISVSLPLSAGPFSEYNTKAFFEGLLPEGFSRKSVARWMHVSEEDYLSILSGLGRECLGAIQIDDGNTVEEPHYRKLTLDEVKELAAEGASQSAKIVTESHLSLTGASGKVGLYYADGCGEWYQPYGTAPSTHIVKQSHIRLSGIVINEMLCLQAARKCGLSVPKIFIIDMGEGNDRDILFATQRYDRCMPKNVKSVDGLPCPYRLHQEDFAQALGIESKDKYEARGSNYLKLMFEILRKYSSAPIEDTLILWDMLAFNYLIGNTDCHLKNFSLLYSSNLSSIRLAPAYDIVSTTAYQACTRKLAMRIGNATTIDEITDDSFRMAAEVIGIGEKTAMTRLEAMKNRFEKALSESAVELTEQGFPQAQTLMDAILRTGGYCKA